MIAEIDQRHFQRIFCNTKAKLQSSEKNWDCEVIDLSLNGCLLNFNSPWQESRGQLFTLIMKLKDDVEIKMQLKTAHVTDNNAGFTCEAIDKYSIRQLHRMVEFNNGDNDFLERDLSSLAILSNN